MQKLSLSIVALMSVAFLTSCDSPTSPAAGGSAAEGIRITLDGKPVEFASAQAKYAYTSFGGTTRNYITFSSPDGAKEPTFGLTALKFNWEYPNNATGSTEVEKAKSIGAILEFQGDGPQNYTAASKPDGMVIDLTTGTNGTVEKINLVVETELPALGVWPARTLKIEANAPQAR